ncbi:hypothetical protein GIB67_013648 [Kingdonia uniflora]|uniref:Nicalin n=1 Tax=Kingdonia uniflora TaxID=39325 RepID=A0A7J7NQL1_9MAGN|nr:hypothetical protein GIB67_013648 [Kingdonia uniflora]
MGASAKGEMLESVYSVLALMFMLVACVQLCDAATVVDVYRLIQYDLAGVPFGSRLANLNHHALSSPFVAGADLSRTVVIVPVRDVNMTFIREYITQRQLLGGLLLLLPQQFNPESKTDTVEGDQINGEELMRGKLAELEQLLIHANIPKVFQLLVFGWTGMFGAVIVEAKRGIEMSFGPSSGGVVKVYCGEKFGVRSEFGRLWYPVYFAFEDNKIDAILADIERNDAIGQPATATTGGSIKAKVFYSKPEDLVNLLALKGWLPGSKADGDANQLPTIAIVASYDTFGAAPALSVGSDSTGSGVVALLEISRLFSRLYSNPKTRGRYNLLFGLTSGGPYNYNGTHKWLRSLDQRVRESIDYAICLNSIGNWDSELWIHVSKPPENAYIKQVFESISSVAEELGVTVGLKHKKINISNPRVAWEHEQFSRLRVTAVTLSELSVAPGLLESTGGLFDSRYFVNETAVLKSVKLVAESLAELGDHTVEANLQQDVLDGMFTFYDSTKAKLSVYQVASVTFDLLLLLALASYLITLYCFLVITTRGLDDLICFFRRPSRKVKTA